MIENAEFCSFYVLFFDIEPSGAPENVSAFITGTRRVLVTWKPVPLSEQNGIITGYTVYYRAVQGNFENGTEQSLRVNASVTIVEVSQLEEYVTYNVSVSAHTSVGEGPRSKGVLERTAEASE